LFALFPYCCKQSAFQPLPKMGEILPIRALFPSETCSLPFLLNGSEKFNRLGFLTVEPSFAAGY
jgi:hypothetical protein